MQCKPGETIQELAARIRQATATCDFTEINDHQDEAMCTQFMCSVNNEAVLQALFKINDGELTFSRAVQIEMETEEAAKVVKETVYELRPKLVNKVSSKLQPKNAIQSTVLQQQKPNTPRAYSGISMGTCI